MLGAYTKKSRGTDKSGCKKIAFAGLLLGAGLNAALLFYMMWRSGGTEPAGMCTFVPTGDGHGLFPFNPNKGGTNDYSCDPTQEFYFFLVVGGALAGILVALLTRAVFYLGNLFRGRS